MTGLPSLVCRLFSRRRRALTSEAGLTLVELMIASLVMSIVVASVAGVMVAMQKVGNRAMSGENASDTARLGLLQLQRDLEAANPLVTFGSSVSVTTYASEVQLLLGPTGGSQQTITWSCSSGTLWRDIGTATGTGVPEVTGVTNCASASNPVFSFFDVQGNNLLANPGSVNSTIMSDCSVRIEGTVAVSAGSNTTPFTESVSIRLANWIKGIQPCP